MRRAYHQARAASFRIADPGLTAALLEASLEPHVTIVRFERR
jgi:hypothetical protein